MRHQLIKDYPCKTPIGGDWAEEIHTERLTRIQRAKPPMLMSIDQSQPSRVEKVLLFFLPSKNPIGFALQKTRLP